MRKRGSTRVSVSLAIRFLSPPCACFTIPNERNGCFAFPLRAYGMCEAKTHPNKCVWHDRLKMKMEIHAQRHKMVAKIDRVNEQARLPQTLIELEQIAIP